jgi:DNA-binding NtrC family response regulator
MYTFRNVLVASPQIEARRALVALLNGEGLGTISVSRAKDCRDVLATHSVQLIFCDIQLTDGTYRDVLATMAAARQEIPVVVTSRLADWNEYGEILRAGGFDLIASPCHASDVLRILSQVRTEDPAAVDSVCPSRRIGEEAAAI